MNQHGALSDHQAASFVEHQHRLLLNRIHSDEAHRRAGDRSADRFCIGSIGLTSVSHIA
jgi:hypothetical protein